MFYFLSIFIFLASLSAPAFGQADYRNLDPGRPITIEDAQPIEFRAFEFSFGSRYGRHQEGYELSFEPELKWGFAKNWQVGVSGERAVLDDGQRTDVLAGTEFHFLYNLNQEDFDLPAIAFRPELTFGAGDLGTDHPHGALKVIVSKTFGFNRVHLNGSYTIGPTEISGRGGISSTGICMASPMSGPLPSNSSCCCSISTRRLRSMGAGGRSSMTSGPGSR